MHARAAGPTQHQRLQILELREEVPANCATQVVTHGANPGLVSHFVKQALLNIARDTGHPLPRRPETRAEWGRLAMELGVKTIHIAERDTQVCDTHQRRRDEFVNTWSVDGFISEGCYQPAELGFGTHEKRLPEDGHRHEAGFGADNAIYLNKPGSLVQVRSWTPKQGPYIGFLVTHAEAISISDYLTVADEKQGGGDDDGGGGDDDDGGGGGTSRSGGGGGGGRVVYRPTCHYSYLPCDAACVSLNELNGWGHEQSNKHILSDDISAGADELGVLLCGHQKGAYWFGSHLTIEQARAMMPFQNATTLQVTAPVVAAMVWALENPDRGIVEPDEMDWERVLDLSMPYLGDVVGQYTDWTPLSNRGKIYSEEANLDRTDPWQFSNVRM